MNVDRRWLGTSVVRVRILLTGLVLLGAGCVVLGWGSRSHQTAANAASGVRAQLAIPASPVAAPGAAKPAALSQARSLFAGLPLMFEPNQGQANLDPSDRRAQFVAHGSGYSLFLGSEGAILNLSSQTSSKPQAKPTAIRVESLQMKLAGANPNPSLTATDPLPGKTNYLLGNDPAKWRRGVPQFARVRYENIYPGIDLVFYGNQGRLEYDFQVAPGSDPAQAELEFDGAKGLELKDGALVIQAEGGSVRLDAPRIYQQIAGRQQPVEGSFVLRGPKRAGFAIGPYDRSRELVIDPQLNYSTYFGGSGDEHSTFVAVDASLKIYLTGSTNSPGLLTLHAPEFPNVYQTTLNPAPNARNVYVAKIDPTLGTSGLIYVTYLGGSGSDTPAGIAVDGFGDAFVAGTTTSTNFPTSTNAYQQQIYSGSTGIAHVFVSELNGGNGPVPPPASELLYSSYLSGNGTDIAGNGCVAPPTGPPPCLTPPPATLPPAGTVIAATTSGMTIDSNGDIYVTGTTTSSNPGSSTGVQFPASSLPYAQPFQSLALSSVQFFVTKVTTSNFGRGTIAYSTYFGGANFIQAPAPAPTGPTVVGGGITVDSNGNIYFSGTTNFIYTGTEIGSGDFPILNAYQPCLNEPPPTVITFPQTCSISTATSYSDAFVAKLNPGPGVGPGQQLQWSTYLGGSYNDSGTGIALDTGAANVYITGTTNSWDFPSASTFASYQKCLNNSPPTTPSVVTCNTQTSAADSDAFVARISNLASSTTTATAVTLGYFSYLGGSANEEGLAIAVDTDSGALLTGWTQSPDLPVSNCADIQCSPANGALQNAFIARINTAATIGLNGTGSWASYFGGSLDANLNPALTQGTSIALDANQNTYFSGDTNSTGANGLRTSQPLQPQNNGGYDAFVTQLATASTLSISGTLTLGTNQTYISAGNQATFTYILTNGGPDPANSITVTDNLLQTYTQLPVTFVSASAAGGTCSSPGSTATSVSCSIPSLQSGSTATITIVLTPTATSTGMGHGFTGGAVQATAANSISSPTILVPASMSDYTIAVNPPNYSVLAAGDTAQYTVVLSPHPVYNSSIALSCSNLPQGAACGFTTTPVTLQGQSPVSPVMNVTTTPRPITTVSVKPSFGRFYAVWLTVPGLALLGLGVGSGGRRRRIVGMLLLCAPFALLLLQPACSHSTVQPPVSGTPAGTTSIVVTATAGSDIKSTTVQLTVP